jgi:disulfide bond formation protein DsbB
MDIQISEKPWPVGYAYLAWFGTIVGTLGSLYFSEIAKYPPCVLCWYQRICMYPLAIIIPIAIVNRDRKLYQYVLPLSLIGLGISIYHNLLYYKILPEAAAPCLAGVSCTTKFIEWFGFLTIPLLAGLGFLGITILMILFRKRVRSSHV